MKKIILFLLCLVLTVNAVTVAYPNKEWELIVPSDGVNHVFDSCKTGITLLGDESMCVVAEGVPENVVVDFNEVLVGGETTSCPDKTVIVYPLNVLIPASFGQAEFEFDLIFQPCETVEGLFGVASERYTVNVVVDHSKPLDQMLPVKQFNESNYSDMEIVESGYGVELQNEDVWIIISFIALISIGVLVFVFFEKKKKEEQRRKVLGDDLGVFNE